MAADSDEIRRAQEGDREAFAALVRRYQRRVYATAYRVVGNHSDADDLTQEAFLRAYRALTDLRRPVGLLHLAVPHRHQPRAQPPPLGPAPADQPLDDGKLPPGWDQSATDPRRQTEAKDLYQRVADAIQSLPPTLRVTVVLALIEEMPHKQVGEILGCSEGTIAWRVNQARKLLRQRLGSRAADLDRGAGRRRRQGGHAGGLRRGASPDPGAPLALRCAPATWPAWWRAASSASAPASGWHRGGVMACTTYAASCPPSSTDGPRPRSARAIAQHLASASRAAPRCGSSRRSTRPCKALPAPQPPEGYHESFCVEADDEDRRAGQGRGQGEEKAAPKEDSGLHRDPQDGVA